MPRWLKRTLKIFSFSIVIVVLLLVVFWLSLQTPAVQNYVTKRGLVYVSEKTDHDFSLSGIRISWFDELKIEDFELRDYKDSTLVKAGVVRLNYDLWEFINEGTLRLEECTVSSGIVQFLNHQDTLGLNLSVFLESLESLTGPSEESVDTTAAQPIFLDKLRVEQVLFSMHDYNQERVNGKADLNHLDFNIGMFMVNDISIKPDSISLDLKEFRGSDEKNGLVLEKFQTRLGFTDKNLILDDLRVETPFSAFGDSVALSFDSPSALGSFQDSVGFYLRVADSRIGAREITNITGSSELKDDVRMEFVISGLLNDFRLRDAKIRMGRSALNMDATIVGLPEIEETFVDFYLNNSRVYTSDIRPYLGDNTDILQGINWLDLTAGISGFKNDFSTKGTLNTNYGGIGADLNVVVPDDPEMASYTGHLQLNNLHVGRLMGDTSTVQRVSLKGRILGKGLTEEKASFLTDFQARNVGIKGYVYDSLSFKGYLASKHFYGSFSVDDPNCHLSGKSDVDLRTVPEKLSLMATIDTLRTKDLRLTDQNIALSTKIDWKQKHLNPDSLTGKLLISDTKFSLDTMKMLAISQFELETEVDSVDYRTVKVEFPGLQMSLDGNYTFKNLAAFLQTESTEIIDYFALSGHHVDEQAPVLDAKLKGVIGDISPFLDFFSPGLSLAEGSNFEMSFEQKPESDGVIKMDVSIDSMVYNDDIFLNNSVNLFASMDPKSNNILGSFMIKSEEQRWKAIPHSKGFELEGLWVNEKLNLSTSISQPETNTRADLQSEIMIFPDSILFSFEPSEIVALGRSYSFDPGNYIRFSKSGLLFRSLDLVSENRRASLNGLLSETEKSSVSFVARNINLDEFNTVLNIPMEGVLEADFSVFKVPEHPLQFSGEFGLEGFKYKDNLIGDIRGSARYDVENEGVDSRLTVARENFETITLEGYYFPERDEQLDFTLLFDQADFKMLEVVTEGNLSNLKGTASGDLKIKGNSSAPEISGYVDLKDIGYKVDYLQTIYEMNGRILLQKDLITLKNFLLRDPNGDMATLKGSISHKNFGDIVTDLQINAKNFNFLNTTAVDNDLYYGTANATGDIYVTGPFSDLVLKVSAKTEKGTRFFIPLSDSESYEQAEFMSFVNLSDTTRNEQESAQQSEGGLGLTVDFDLDVTTDAYCELIFDIKTGDIIRGRGNGNLKLKLDKNGNFELFGPLTIEEGGYNFTVPNFINKEFQVVPGSTLTWYGDPYSGTMNMTAVYRQKASFADLSSNPEDQEDGELTQKMPVIVMLELTGQMLSPTIDFDIQLDESAGQSQKITRLLTQVRGDEQQLKRQVVSLLFLKRFSPLQDGFVGGGAGGSSIGKSLSEFLTNQISYLASQIDENLEVEVDLTNLDQEGFNTFQLRLAYTFMDGRLKVTRGGDFSSTATNDNGVVSDIIGDWSVEYMLTRDGKLRAKMFSQSSQILGGLDGQQAMETGLSLKYVTSFNKFKEVLTRTRSEALQRKEEEEEPTTESGLE